MKNSGPGDFVLGLDIGANSVGWALMERRNGAPAALAGLGVRAFAAGVAGNIESGKDEPRAVARRGARLMRRMTDRRARRRRKIGRLLQAAGLLPQGEAAAEADFFAQLDRRLADGKRDAALLPYRLRARALDKKLEPHELGRALYHLAQRRGFLSNRKAPRRKDEDEGAVKEGIGKLYEEMKNSGARTLGEHLARLDPQEERIRQRWTAREMFEGEFKRIWETQQPHHLAILTEEFRKKLHRAIFFQRPLKWDRDTVGDCELEPGRKRAPVATAAAQRFRLLQKVNDLEIRGVDKATGEVLGPRKLTPEERASLAAKLEVEGDLSFAKIRKLLGLPKWATFNFEEGGEKKLIGNRTNAALRDIFGERWDTLTPEERDRIVEDIRSIQKPDAQYRRGKEAYKLEGEAAKKFADLALEDDHSSLSREALKRVLPLMEQGKPYATARKELYGDRPAPKPLEELPPLVSSSLPEIRNPAVQRALNEVRKVVNAVVRQYGRPAEIRIELARDLKKNREDRKRISKRNVDNRQRRKEAGEKLLHGAGIQQPKGRDIDKWLLAEECNWTCPYTGRQINAVAIFGANPQFDIEHIIPFSRCLDDSFLNKTLCAVDENRDVKQNRTPWEAYGGNPETWDAIVQRVKRLSGDAREIKLERFQLKDLEEFEDFTERQLADTRYASRQAMRYVGLLYGAGVEGTDPEGKRVLQAGRGQVTKYLRDEYGLNRILGDGGEKSREDHRHHAVDAVCIALTDAKTVKALSDAAARARVERRRRFGNLAPPWPGFYDEVKAAVEKLVVSHRVARKVNAALHDETFYSKPQKDAKERDCVHVRKKLEALSSKEAAEIVDPTIRELVRVKLAGGEPKKVFADKANPLRMKSGVPIRSVRIRKYDKTVTIGQGARERRVISRSNHHVEIFEAVEKDKQGRPKLDAEGKPKTCWAGAVVTTMEAMRRLRAGEAIVQRQRPEGGKFLFSLCGGDTVEIDEPKGARGVYIVASISEGDLWLVHLNDARRQEKIKRFSFRDWSNRKAQPIALQGKGPPSWRVRSWDQLRQMSAKKVTVTPLGEVRRAND